MQTKKVVGIAAAIAAIILIAVVGYGAWSVARKWNYEWGYEPMVKATVCSLVKPEYLKDPCDE